MSSKFYRTHSHDSLKQKPQMSLLRSIAEFMKWIDEQMCGWMNKWKEGLPDKQGKTATWSISLPWFWFSSKHISLLDVITHNTLSDLLINIIIIFMYLLIECLPSSFNYQFHEGIYCFSHCWSLHLKQCVDFFEHFLYHSALVKSTVHS